ncbi:MAG: hypothetical protein SF053_15635 [Bacteroidia bacterium]|nr:hypothetical protein [Bacteroidia bacterium]
MRSIVCSILLCCGVVSGILAQDDPKLIIGNWYLGLPAFSRFVDVNTGTWKGLVRDNAYININFNPDYTYQFTLYRPNEAPGGLIVYINEAGTYRVEGDSITLMPATHLTKSWTAFSKPYGVTGGKMYSTQTQRDAYQVKFHFHADSVAGTEDLTRLDIRWSEDWQTLVRQ